MPISHQRQGGLGEKRPITLIVPFPAGGPSDALARAVAQGMSIPLQQPIVVENISGASGAIGLTKLARSAPDGYTFGFGTVGTHVANAALYKKLPYDPLADFEPIGLAGTAPTMLVARLRCRRPACRTSWPTRLPTAPRPPMAVPASARSRILPA